MAIFAKNVRFLYYKEANKKRHLPLKVAPMCAKAHIIRNSEMSCTEFCLVAEPEREAEKRTTWELEILSSLLSS